MSSRANPSVRREPEKKPRSPRSKCGLKRELPEASEIGYGRKMVCRRCHVVMLDSEPATMDGRFYHHNGLNLLTGERKPRVESCANLDQTFSAADSEVEPFLPKARRRLLKRRGIQP